MYFRFPHQFLCFARGAVVHKIQDDSPQHDVKMGAPRGAQWKAYTTENIFLIRYRGLMSSRERERERESGERRKFASGKVLFVDNRLQSP